MHLSFKHMICRRENWATGWGKLLAVALISFSRPAVPHSSSIRLFPLSPTPSPGPTWRTGHLSPWQWLYCLKSQSQISECPTLRAVLTTPRTFSKRGTYFVSP